MKENHKNYSILVSNGFAPE